MQVVAMTPHTDQNAEKQPYTRPELVKHGKVEAMTLGVPYPGTSRQLD